MKKYVALSLLFLTSVGVVLNHVSFEALDDSHVLNVDGMRWDVWGAAQDRLNTLTRQCEGVKRVTEEQDMDVSLWAAVREHSPPDSRQMKVRQLHSTGQWYLAEVSFETLQPAVILLKRTGNKIEIQEGALWSGSVGLWLPGPWIRRYLQRQAVAAPADLLACYEPSPGLFKPQ
jgi:hypothetical protein